MTAKAEAVVRATRSALTFNVLGLLVSFAAQIILVRTLGAPLFAVFALVLSLHAWSLLLVDAGSSSGYMFVSSQMHQVRARRTVFLRIVAMRMVAVVVLAGVAGLGIHFLGPRFGIASVAWSPGIAFLLVVAVTASAIGQLAQYALYGTFSHASAGTVTQSMALIRGVLIGAVALAGGQIVAVFSVFCVATVVEAGLLFRRVWRDIGQEDGAAANGVRDAYRHGFVSFFDKVSSGIGGTQFLVLALAFYYDSTTIAAAALAGDFVQKMLSVTGLPMSTIVLPYLNSQSRSASYASAVEKVFRAGFLLFAVAIGGVMAVSSHALPLLFGDVPDLDVIALIIAPATFIESLCRLTISCGVLTARNYRLSLGLNALQFLAALAVLAATFTSGILLILIGQAAVRICFSALLAIYARRQGLFEWAWVDLRLTVSVVIATGVAAVLPGMIVPGISHALGVLVSLASFLVLMRLAASQLCLPVLLRAPLTKVMGRYAGIFFAVTGMKRTEGN